MPYWALTLILWLVCGALVALLVYMLMRRPGQRQRSGENWYEAERRALAEQEASRAEPPCDCRHHCRHHPSDGSGCSGCGGCGNNCSRPRWAS